MLKFLKILIIVLFSLNFLLIEDIFPHRHDDDSIEAYENHPYGDSDCNHSGHNHSGLEHRLFCHKKLPGEDPHKDFNFSTSLSKKLVNDQSVTSIIKIDLIAESVDISTFRITHEKILVEPFFKYSSLRAPPYPIA